jgi:CSLREA domain-containing protein/uncharacterized repeat protein (TIGR01451 family)
MITKSQSLLASLFLPFVALGTLFLVFVLYLPTQAKGGTYVVNTTEDTTDGSCNVAHCTLREAILAANASAEADTITFSLPPSATITLNGTQLPVITGTLTIDGSTAVSLTVSGDSASRVFVIGQAPPPYPRPGKSAGGGIVTITDLTIVDGNDAYGGSISNGGTLVLMNSTISDSVGIYGNIYNNSVMTITDSAFSSNNVSEDGGVLYNTLGSSVTISNSHFINNSSFGEWDGVGGAIFNNGGDVSLIGSTFISNTASSAETLIGGYGGAVYNGNNSNLWVDKSNFTDNSVSHTGGAIWNDQFGTVSVSNSTFKANSAGSIFARGGGAIYNRGILTILNTTMSGNVGHLGGGIFNSHNNSQASVTNSTFNGNLAVSGGAIRHTVGDFYLVNSTLSENSADFGSGINNQDGDFHLINSIIGNGVNGEDCRTDTSPLSTNINNLIEDGTCNPLLTGDPLLGPLQANGGTTWTHALMFGSPAIDAGDSITCANPPVNNLDQRGEIRPVDGDGDGMAVCDIGAYEAPSPQLSLVKNAPSLAGAGEFITYTLTAANYLTTTVTNVVLTDTIPTNATYISGGTLIGNVVSWTLPSLAVGETFTRSFIVTATQTITNHDYRVSAAGGYSTTSSVPVVTIVVEPITGLAATNDSPTTIGNMTTLMASTATGGDVSYAWTFGDGDTGNGANTTHTYPDVGVYTAVVTATNPVSTLTATTVVTITDAPITGLSASNNSPTPAGSPTTLMATVTSGTNINYTWNFGDGTTGSGANTSHVYPDVGVYTAVVTATNSVSTVAATTLVTIEQDTWTTYLPVVLNQGGNAHQAAQPTPLSLKRYWR